MSSKEFLPMKNTMVHNYLGIYHISKCNKDKLTIKEISKK